MSSHHESSDQRRDSRRAFLAKSVLLASTAAGAQLAISRSVHAAGSDTIKLGLIGCGGRGSGAAADALSGDPNTQLWAMADLFADKIEASVKNLSTEFGDRIQVDPSRRLAGSTSLPTLYSAERQLTHLLSISSTDLVDIRANM